MLHVSCNIGIRELPDIYASALRLAILMLQAYIFYILRYIVIVASTKREILATLLVFVKLQLGHVQAEDHKFLFVVYTLIQVWLKSEHRLLDDCVCIEQVMISFICSHVATRKQLANYY